LIANEHLPLIALALAWIACGTPPAPLPPQQAPPSPAPIAADPVPVGISALERFLDEPGHTAEQRYRAISRLATLQAFTEANFMNAANAPTHQHMLSEYAAPTYRRRTLIAIAATATSQDQIETAQQAYRSAACPASYSYPPASPRLPQDHDVEYWHSWFALHGAPLDEDQSPRAPSVAAPSDAKATTDEHEETTYQPIFAACAPPAESEKSLMASVWLDIAAYHADEPGWGGPYALQRALEAYDMALRSSPPRSLGHILAQLGATHTLYRLQRYRDAAQAAVATLTALEQPMSVDEVTAESLRSSSVHILAHSLTFVDFIGPPAADPYIARNDVLDLYTDEAAVEKELSVALDRVRDPKVVPQDRPWTAAVYQALAIEYKTLDLTKSYIATLEALLIVSPTHRGAPVAQHRIALAFDQLASIAQSPVDYQKQARQARSRLIETYGPSSPWARANEGDTAALKRARSLTQQTAGPNRRAE
jgi:hypothetical protein